jgi:serine/threonine protein kinase
MDDGYYQGQLFGSYRLLRLLGRGSFSEIYLGEHELFHTQAAVKILSGKREENDKAKFLAQASVLVHLQHPHIARVHDFGARDGVAFLVMDLAPGGTLRQRHPRGTRVPPEAVITYVKQVASALQYIHEHKLIHRDVKPHNMLLGINGEIMLSDFGIAVVSQSLDPLDPGFHDFEGTVPYSAPEQLIGKPRRSSDQYSLGIVVYEWLCGDWPFSGSFNEIVHQHLYVEPPSLLEKNPTLAPGVEQVVLRALTKDPEDRYTDIRAFADALIQALDKPLALISGRNPQRKRGRQFMSPLPFLQEAL